MNLWFPWTFLDWKFVLLSEPEWWQSYLYSLLTFSTTIHSLCSPTLWPKWFCNPKMAMSVIARHTVSIQDLIGKFAFQTITIFTYISPVRLFWALQNNYNRLYLFFTFCRKQYNWFWIKEPHRFGGMSDRIPNAQTKDFVFPQWSCNM